MDESLGGGAGVVVTVLGDGGDTGWSIEVVIMDGVVRRVK